MKDKNSESKERSTYPGFMTLRLLVKYIRAGEFGTLVEDWKWIFAYSLRYKWGVAIYIALGVLGSVMSLASALASKYLIDIITTMDSSRLWLLIIIFVGSTALSIAFTALSTRVSAKVSVNINNSIQAEVFEKIMDSRWQALAKYRHGDILNRFTNDVSSVASSAITWLPNLVTYGFSFIASFCVILYYDVTMALIAFASAPFLIFSTKYLVQRLKEHNKRLKESLSELTSFETETFSNIDTLKSFGVEERTARGLRGKQDEYKNATLEYNRFTVKTNAWLSSIASLVQFAAFAYCLWRLWSGAITYGTMTLFLQQRASIASSFSKLASLLPTALSSAISSERVRELVNLKKEEHYGRPENIPAGGCAISLSDVNFSYVAGGETLKDVSFRACPGEIIGIIGESGGGKTTTMRLVLGLVVPDSGSAKITFADGSEMPLGADAREYLGYVPQGNTVMSGTIAENLRLTREDATDDELVAALKTACAWDFVSRLPEGIYSSVGERGSGLSEGQCQRIAIARALVKDAPVLLLDEATSALDEVTERNLLNNIMTARPDKTIIVTTHRPGVLGMCTRVYRVQDGTASECTA